MGVVAEWVRWSRRGILRPIGFVAGVGEDVVGCVQSLCDVALVVEEVLGDGAARTEGFAADQAIRAEDVDGGGVAVFSLSVRYRHHSGMVAEKRTWVPYNIGFRRGSAPFRISRSLILCVRSLSAMCNRIILRTCD